MNVSEVVAALLLSVLIFPTVIIAGKTTDNGPTANFLRSDPYKLQDYEERGKMPRLADVGEKINSIVKSTQQKIWLTYGRPAEDLLSRMTSVLKEDNPLANSKLQVWLKHVDDLNQKHPREAKSAASMLTAHYGDNQYGNSLLSTKLNAAMENEHTKVFALKLQAQRLEDWGRKNTAPLAVFDMLLLRNHDVLKNPLLISWFKYVEDFNARNPVDKMTLISTLSLGFGTSDRGLVEVLEAGLNAGGTKDIATKLKTQLFAEWEAKKLTPDLVFESTLRLKQGYTDSNAPGLSDPILKFWIRYMEWFNLKHPHKQKTTLFDTLRNHFDYDAIVRMLVDAKLDPASKASARDLESLLFAKWLDGKLTPQDIARWLRADRSDAMFDEYKRLFEMKWPNGV
ncbi:hypothetical protein AM587_10002317 [Phytophthora nicotianae]|uniref:RxLR effector protein n=2 Tax=Phytophthora nicotianae TaxID=4792 RepID=A0A0W8DYR6_PHYNI|nr:hypothetical protein AM587_10002317 [Phytophthora nicotianae]